MRNVTSKRRALLALLLLVPAPSLGTLVAMWIAPGSVGKAVYFACKCWILALPLVWTLFVDKAPLSFSPVRRGGFGVGASAGLAIGAAMLAAFWVFARDALDPAPLHALAQENGFAALGVYLAFAGYLTLVNSLLEEYVWRWFVLSKCERLMPTALAVPAAALFFTIHHVVALRSYLPWSTTLLTSSGVFIGGVLWGWMYARYRSVWPAYLSHALVDTAVFVIGYVLLFA